MINRNITAYSGTLLELGKCGENGAVKIAFPVESILEEFGAGGVFRLMNQWPDGDLAYPTEAELAGSKVIWTVTNRDNPCAGKGMCELQYIKDGTVVKSETWTTRIAAALGESDEIPEAAQRWQDEVNAAAARAESAERDAERAMTEALGIATSTRAIAAAVADGKQDKLTAGVNITIVDNVISATGGSESHYSEVTATWASGYIDIGTAASGSAAAVTSDEYVYTTISCGEGAVYYLTAQTEGDVKTWAFAAYNAAENKYTYLERGSGSLTEKVVAAPAGTTTLIVNCKASATKGIQTYVPVKGQTTVTYKEFGAVLDGVSDDGMAVRAAHGIANAYGLKVVSGKGSLKCNFYTLVKTSCDFEGLTLKVDDDTPNGVFKVFHDEAYAEAINGGVTTDTTVTEGTMRMNCSDATYSGRLYGKFFIVDKSTAKIGCRKKSTLATEADLHAQPVLLDKEGFCLTAPFYKTVSKARCRYISDPFEKAIEIKGGTVAVNRAAAGNAAVIDVERNNVTVTGWTVALQALPTSSGSNEDGIFHFARCCNVTLENVIGLNNSTDAEVNASYITNAVYAFNVTYRSIVMAEGWGAMATHYVDRVTFDNCVINRIDNHKGCFGDWHINKCKLVGISYIVMGYGNADVHVTDTVWEKSVERQGYCVSVRLDYPITYGGRLIVRDCEVRTSSLVQSFFEYDRRAVAIVGGSAECSTALTFDPGAPELFVNNLTGISSDSLVVNKSGDGNNNLPSGYTAAQDKQSVTIEVSGGGGGGGSTAWADITGKPSSFPPSAHEHTVSEISDFPSIPTDNVELANGAGYVTASYHDSSKQDVISDLATIRSNAAAGAAVTDDHINSLIDAKIGSLETLSASVLELIGDEVSG